jgi:hypothetical protein
MIKNTVLAILLFCCFAINASAYDNEDVAGMMKKWGAKIGGNIASIYDSQTQISFDSKFGLLFGAYSRMPLSDNFILQFELGYSSIGSSGYSLGYINLGGTPKFYINDDNTGLNFLVGLLYGYLLTATTSGLDISGSLYGSDFDIVAGAGYELESGLNFELRYMLGLSDIWDDTKGNGQFIWKNRAIQIQIGWTF